MIEIAVIGGSGAYSLLSRKNLEGKKLGPIITPFGSSHPIYEIKAGSDSFYFLSRHGEIDYTITATEVNYRANIYSLKELGVKKIISWSGPGAINTKYPIGTFVIPHDVIDETKSRESTFFKGKGIGFIRQSPTFCPAMRDVLIRSLNSLSKPFFQEGIYVCTEGPRLETAAEINKFRIIGGDLVGMTLVPEVFLAKEMEICYAAICYITNYAEGIRERDFKEGVLFEGLLDEDELDSVNKAVDSFPEIITNTIKLMKENYPDCRCSKILDRYRKKGLI